MFSPRTKYTVKCRPIYFTHWQTTLVEWLKNHMCRKPFLSDFHLKQYISKGRFSVETNHHMSTLFNGVHLYQPGITTFTGLTDPSALQGIQIQNNMFALARQLWRPQEHVSSRVFGGYMPTVNSINKDSSNSTTFLLHWVEERA